MVSDEAEHPGSSETLLLRDAKLFGKGEAWVMEI